jgi:hypothetical protein
MRSVTFWRPAPHAGARVTDKILQATAARVPRTFTPYRRSKRILMLPVSSLHFTDLFTPNAVLAARQIPLFRLPYVYSRLSPVHTPRLPSRFPRH